MNIAGQADRREMLQHRNKLAFILSLNQLFVEKPEQSWTQAKWKRQYSQLEYKKAVI